MPAEPALRAVREAAQTLSERDAAFTGKALEQRARFMSLGLAGAEQIERAVTHLHGRGELVERQVRAIDPVTRQPTLMPGWTTAAMIETERRMLALEQAGRGAVDRLMHRLDAQALIGQARALAEERGFGWTQGQVDATGHPHHQLAGARHPGLCRHRQDHDRARHRRRRGPAARLHRQGHSLGRNLATGLLTVGMACKEWVHQTPTPPAKLPWCAPAPFSATQKST